MNPSSRRSKTPAALSVATQQRLNMYAVAASAAGVGILALLPSAEAKIVYTPTHQHITPANWVHIDLNHDGINDFVLEARYHFSGTASASALYCFQENSGGKNRIMGGEATSSQTASALRAGARIGPAKKFLYGANHMAQIIRHSHKTSLTFRWPWANGGKGVKNRYLGVRFIIKGKAHFGWARVNVSFTANHDINAVLTGYAYETIPGKAIIAGATKGPDEAEPISLNTAAPGPATLGMLALGAPGLSIWRRDESVVAAPEGN
jgi:hypothetical protein